MRTFSPYIVQWSIFTGAYLSIIGVYLVAMWLTKSPRTNFSSRFIMKLLLFNNHIIMAHSDNESKLSEAFTTAINSFIIAARSVIFTKIVKYIRNIDSRRSVIFKNLCMRTSSSELV